MSCPRCHGNHRGWERCIPKVSAMPSPLDQAAEFIANLAPKRGVNKVANAPVVVLTEKPLVLTDGVNKQSSGVNRNSDRHREGYMRDYMAKRRGNHVS